MTFAEWVCRSQKALERSEVWFGHGTDNAADEAVWLVLSAIGAAADGSFTGWDDVAGKEQDQKIAGLLKRRIDSRKPLAYLTGEAWFCSLRFTVSEQVAVPRSPIAELIRQRFAPWVQMDRISRVLDLCTGSGCIAIAIARNMPWLRVDAADVSVAALQVAAQNRQLHGLGERVELIVSDLFADLERRQYGLIVSNPPYVSKAVFDSLPAEYHAEPEEALVSGMEGLALALEILIQSTAFLDCDGVLICEVGESAALLQASLPGLPLTWIDFEHGGGGVFTLTRNELLEHQQAIMTLRHQGVNGELMHVV